MSAKPHKPPALRSGDTVGVVATSAAVERAYLERGVGALVAMGYRVKVSDRVLDRAGVIRWRMIGAIREGDTTFVAAIRDALRSP